MNRFFKPYEGTRPYLFISYAHKQSEEVVSTIRILHENGREPYAGLRGSALL